MWVIQRVVHIGLYWVCRVFLAGHESVQAPFDPSQVTFVAVPPPDDAGGRHLATGIQLLPHGTISASFEDDLPGGFI